VTLRFTIDVDGTTKDIEVVESTSPVFEQPAVEALGKWRYALQRENGALVARHGVQTVMRFELRR
jgi:TonB family protein